MTTPRTTPGSRRHSSGGIHLLHRRAFVTGLAGLVAGAATWSVTSPRDDRARPPDVAPPEQTEPSGRRPLTWAPPSDHERYQALDIASSSDGDVVVYDLDDEVDYRIEAPSIVRNGVVLRGGRNIVCTTGMHLRIDDKGTGAPADLRRALLVQDVGGERDGRFVHLEGLLIDGDDLADAVNLDCPTAVVQIQHCRVDGVHFRSGFDRDHVTHPDIIQTYGSCRELRVDGLSGRSAYQGIFLKEDHPDAVLGPTWLRHVELEAYETDGRSIPHGDGFDYAGHRMLFKDDRLTGTLRLDDVWVRGHERNGWYRALPNPRPGSDGYYHTRYDTGSGSSARWVPRTTHHSFARSTESWMGASDEVVEHQVRPQGGQPGALRGSRRPGSRAGGINVVSALRSVTDLSLLGTSLVCSVRLVATADRTPVTARLQVRTTGFEPLSADAETPLLLGQWTQVTWTPAAGVLADVARLGLEIRAPAGAGEVVVDIADYQQGDLVPGEPRYATDVAHPGGAPSADATGPAPPMSGSDVTGPYVTMGGTVRDWSGARDGRVRLGVPADGPFVPAATTGTRYVSPGYAT